MNKQDYYNSLFEYINGEVFWKVSRGNTKIGYKAGTLNYNKVYDREVYEVGIDKKTMLLHRVIWIMFNGDITEDLQIDHINQTPTDNRIENLRLVTCAENNKNKSMDKRNTSGYSNIYYYENKISKWKVEISCKGKRISKSFLTLEEALQYRDEKYIELNFHPNHGKNKKN